jgi:DNA-binding Lrp family transcriptional regulator
MSDYETIFDLIIEVINEGVAASVSEVIRETVGAVESLFKQSGKPITVRTLAEYLRIDRSAAARRVSKALNDGYLINEETRKFHTMQLKPGDSLPDNENVLPVPEDLKRGVGVNTTQIHVHRCTGQVETPEEIMEKVSVKMENKIDAVYGGLF